MKRIFEDINPCLKCGLDKGCNTPHMKPTGSIGAEYYALGEGPGKEEDKVGEQFKGKTGTLLRNVLDDLDIEHKCRFNNGVACRPPNNRDPSINEIILCRPNVIEDIKKVKPKVVMAFGNYAMLSLYPDRSTGITVYSGRTIPNWDLNCWVVPIYHPSYVHRHKGYKGSKSDYDAIFERDITTAIDLSYIDDCEKFFLPPEEFEKDNIPILNWGELESFFSVLISAKRYAFDYETVNIRPFDKGSKIVSASFSINGTAYAFPLDKHDTPWTPSQLKKIYRWLSEAFSKPKVIKICHNLKFEYAWTYYFIKVRLRGVLEDTQLLAYALDERNSKPIRAHSLDFLSFSLLGFDYKSMIDKYIKNMDLCPMDLLLEYGGLDSKVTDVIRDVLKSRLSKDQYKMYRNFLVGPVPALSRSELKGMKIDSAKLKEFEKDAYKKHKAAESKLLKLKCIAKFKRKYRKSPNLNSNKDVADILFTILNLEPVKFTKNDNASTDQSVLEFYKKDQLFCNLLLEQREYGTLLGSTIKNIQNSMWLDGRVHTNWNVTVARTGRTSSSNPNMQNMDKRKHPEIRTVFVADEGYVLLSADYSQIEPRNIAMASKCKAFCDVIRNNYDIYYDWGERIYGKKAMMSGGNHRFLIKNQMILPSFYGAGPGSISKSLEIEEYKIKQHQNDLWKMFPGVKEWQEDLLNFYEENLYVETLTGRRRHAPLTHNQILNSPIQGTAADFLVWSVKELLRRGKVALLLVHDEVVIQVKYEDVFDGYELLKDVMTNLPEKAFPFINVPVEIDCSVGETWYDMIDIEEVL